MDLVRAEVAAHDETGKPVAAMLGVSVVDEAVVKLDAIRRYSQAWLARVRFEQGRWDEAAGLLTSDLDECLIGNIVALTVDGASIVAEPLADAPGTPRGVCVIETPDDTLLVAVGTDPAELHVWRASDFAAANVSVSPFASPAVGAKR